MVTFALAVMLFRDCGEEMDVMCSESKVLEINDESPDLKFLVAFICDESRTWP